MDDKKVKLEQDWSDSLRVNVSGCLPIITMLAILWGAFALTAIDQRLNESNKIKSQQHDLAKQQYRLDSMRYKMDSVRYHAPFHTR